MKLNKQLKNAFTLVELIVVMAIIGILTAIAVPRFTSFIQTARHTAVVAEADSVYSAVTVAETTLLSAGDEVTSDELANTVTNDNLVQGITLTANENYQDFEEEAQDAQDHTWGVFYDDANKDIYLTNITGDDEYTFKNGEEYDRMPPPPVIP